MDKQLCDKDELIAAFNTSEYGTPERSEEWTFPNKLAVQIVEDMPEVDAVEVVRCKDCKWYAKYREIPPFVTTPFAACNIRTTKRFAAMGKGGDDDATD